MYANDFLCPSKGYFVYQNQEHCDSDYEQQQVSEGDPFIRRDSSVIEKGHTECENKGDPEARNGRILENIPHLFFQDVSDVVRTCPKFCQALEYIDVI